MGNIEKMNAPVADRLAYIIKERGLKQCVVAKKAGLSYQDFNDMLKGRRIIKACDIPAISDALGVTPNELYGINHKST